MITKQDIFQEHLKEYIKAKRERKTQILDHITNTTKLCRESVIRRFKRMQTRGPTHIPKSGRKVYYTKDVGAALHTVWEAANSPCGELLHSLVSEYVQILQRDKMWHHSTGATGKLLAMSERTMRRRSRGFRKKYKIGKGKSTTRPSPLKSIIPIFKGSWKNLPPGEGQLDTVIFCLTIVCMYTNYSITKLCVNTYFSNKVAALPATVAVVQQSCRL